MTSIVDKHLNLKTMNGAGIYIHHTAEECGTRRRVLRSSCSRYLLLACIAGSSAAYVI